MIGPCKFLYPFEYKEYFSRGKKKVKYVKVKLNEMVPRSFKVFEDE